MKHKPMALLLVLVMVVAAFTAVGVTTSTKVSAVPTTRTTLTVTKTNPIINEQVTFTASAERWVYDHVSHTFRWQPVKTPITLTIWHYEQKLTIDPSTHLPIVRSRVVTDKIAHTTTGSITWQTSWPTGGHFSGTLGFYSWRSERTYSASSRGGNVRSTSGPVLINVRIPTTLTIGISWTMLNPQVFGALHDQNWNGLGLKTIRIYSGPSPTSLSWERDTLTSDGSDAFAYPIGSFWTSISPQGIPYYYQARFEGDLTYGPFTSDIVKYDPLGNNGA